MTLNNNINSKFRCSSLQDIWNPSGTSFYHFCCTNTIKSKSYNDSLWRWNLKGVPIPIQLILNCHWLICIWRKIDESGWWSISKDVSKRWNVHTQHTMLNASMWSLCALGIISTDNCWGQFTTCYSTRWSHTRGWGALSHDWKLHCSNLTSFYTQRFAKACKAEVWHRVTVMHSGIH